MVEALVAADTLQRLRRLPELQRALRDAVAPSHEACAAAMGGLLGLLRDNNPKVCLAALDALVALLRLIERAEDGRAATRAQSARVVASLVDRMGDGKLQVRVRATQVFVQVAEVVGAHHALERLVACDAFAHRNGRVKEQVRGQGQERRGDRHHQRERRPLYPNPLAGAPRDHRTLRRGGASIASMARETIIPLAAVSSATERRRAHAAVEALAAALLFGDGDAAGGARSLPATLAAASRPRLRLVQQQLGVASAWRAATPRRRAGRRRTGRRRTGRSQQDAAEQDAAVRAVATGDGGAAWRRVGCGAPAAAATAWSAGCPGRCRRRWRRRARQRARARGRRAVHAQGGDARGREARGHPQGWPEGRMEAAYRGARPTRRHRGGRALGRRARARGRRLRGAQAAEGRRQRAARRPRSAVVREACEGVARMARAMAHRFEYFALHFVENLLKQCHVSIQVISAASNCVRELSHARRKALAAAAPSAACMRNSTLRTLHGVRPRGDPVLVGRARVRVLGAGLGAAAERALAQLHDRLAHGLVAPDGRARDRTRRVAGDVRAPARRRRRRPRRAGSSST